VENTTYQVTFGERISGRKSFTLRRVDGERVDDPGTDGVVFATGITDRGCVTEQGIRIWACRAGDPFWIEPDFLHAVGHALRDGTLVDLHERTSDPPQNLFAGHAVNSLVLEVPDGEFVSGSASPRRIGARAVAWLATDAGGWRPINRAQLPMMHPLFTQFNEALGDSLNGGRPKEDFVRFGEVMAREVAGAVRASGTAADADTYGRDFARRVLPNVSPYTVGTPAVFGYLQWNGRSLIDKAPDVMFSLACNRPIGLGIGKASVTSAPRDRFPYVPLAS
jgi:hypothetical protein